MTKSTVSASIHRLNVYKDTLLVGVLTCDALGRTQFTYDEAVLEQPEAEVSVRLPRRRAPYDDHVTLPCFENLLPEGDIRQTLAAAAQRGAKDVVGLLGIFGGECAGALSLWPDESAPPSPPTYRPCGANDLGNALGEAHSVTQIVHLLRQTRQTMSGAQDKLVLYRRPASGSPDLGHALEYRLPVAGASSTVLLKRDRGACPGLLQNEIAAMSLMAACGVPTAHHARNALLSEVYETARFDRVLQPDGSVQRLHAEDGCQLTGKVSIAKYAGTHGPTYADLVAVLKRHSADPRVDGEHLFRWAVANLAIGNRDAHAKNVSMLYHDAETKRLAPVYDVICTVAYEQRDLELPMRFGGQVAMAGLTPGAVPKAAREFGLTAQRAVTLIDEVTTSIRGHLSDVLHTTAEVAGSHDILATMSDAVTHQTAMVRKHLLNA